MLALFSLFPFYNYTSLVFYFIIVIIILFIYYISCEILYLKVRTLTTTTEGWWHMPPVKSDEIRRLRSSVRVDRRLRFPSHTTPLHSPPSLSSVIVFSLSTALWSTLVGWAIKKRDTPFFLSLSLSPQTSVRTAIAHEKAVSFS